MEILLINSYCTTRPKGQCTASKGDNSKTTQPFVFPRISCVSKNSQTLHFYCRTREFERQKMFDAQKNADLWKTQSFHFFLQKFKQVSVDKVFKTFGASHRRKSLFFYRKKSPHIFSCLCSTFPCCCCFCFKLNFVGRAFKLFKEIAQPFVMNFSYTFEYMKFVLARTKTNYFGELARCRYILQSTVLKVTQFSGGRFL